MPLSRTVKWSSGVPSLPSSRKVRLVMRSISLRPSAPGPISIDATCALSSTLNAFVRGLCEASARSRRSASTALVVSETTIPSPAQVGQRLVRISRGPSVTFCRVISTRPSGEISTT